MSPLVLEMNGHPVVVAAGTPEGGADEPSPERYDVLSTCGPFASACPSRTVKRTLKWRTTLRTAGR